MQLTFRKVRVRRVCRAVLQLLEGLVGPWEPYSLMSAQDRLGRLCRLLLLLVLAHPLCRADPVPLLSPCRKPQKMFVAFEFYLPDIHCFKNL